MLKYDLMAATMPGRYQCPTCLKCYKRREHLQRHYSLHTSERPYRCLACNRAFQRSDVLKRHLQICGELNPSSKVITRRRACDRCVRQKKACNSGQPCQNCLKKAVECSFSVNGEAVSIDGVSDPLPDPNKEAFGEHEAPMLSIADASIPFGFEDSSLEDIVAAAFNTANGPGLLEFSSTNWQDFNSQFLSTPNAGDKDLRPSFTFLDNFTSNRGIVGSYDCGSLSQRQQVLAAIGKEEVYGPSFQQYQLPGLSFALEDLDARNALNSILLFQPYCIPDPFLLKTHQILLLVKEAVTVKPRNSAVTSQWSPVLEQMCLQFFSPLNMRKYLRLFWAIWHPNVNFLHRPTFDPASSKPTLLAAMTLIGASVSPETADSENARIWYNCVEEMVFTDDDFTSDDQYVSNVLGLAPAINIQKTQALQAAFIVCQYQSWEGDDASRRRVRRYRYNTVVSVARDIGINMARHIDYSQCSNDIENFNWDGFVAREELIRTFLWIFLLDTAFVLFNNVPPRMVIKEMKMHMACPEACFQAATAEECLMEIKRWLPAGNPFYRISFRSAFECVCRESITLHMQQTLADLGPLNLFAIISGLHCLIFQYQNSFGGGQLLAPILHGLNNWKDIWNLYSSCDSSILPHSTIRDEDLRPENMWKRIGFVRHASEFWLLASLMMDRIAALNASQTVNNTGKDLNGINPLEDDYLDPLPNKYDQTSMRQVNDLISDFQKVQIH